MVATKFFLGDATGGGMLTDRCCFLRFILPANYPFIRVTGGAYGWERELLLPARLDDGSVPMFTVASIKKHTVAYRDPFAESGKALTRTVTPAEYYEFKVITLRPRPFRSFAEMSEVDACRQIYDNCGFTPRESHALLDDGFDDLEALETLEITDVLPPDADPDRAQRVKENLDVYQASIDANVFNNPL